MNYYARTELPSSAIHLFHFFGGLCIILGLFFIFLKSPRARRRPANGMIAGGALLCIAAGLFGFVFYRNADKGIPEVFSRETMLHTIWENYKQTYVGKDGRTMDPDRDGATTSEGESYTMLRAAWMDDKDAFDRSWQWTKNNLQRGNDHLFSWLYGKRADGTYGILLGQDGGNTATDADEDIALSLIFAYSRWQDDQYLKDAIAIIPDIWDKEVAMLNGRPYLAAQDITSAAPQDNVIINPSYFAPYTYRIFARIDTMHPWSDLVDTSYEILQKSITTSFGDEKSAGLPPNWISIVRSSGELSGIANASASTHFGFDAIRIPLRIALDSQWYGEPRAKNMLEQLGFLEKEWQEKHVIYATYSHGGIPDALYESPATYGGAIGYFIVHNQSEADQIYLEKLQVLFDTDTQTWKMPLDYYDANIAWFGMALYNQALPNYFLLANPSRTGQLSPKTIIKTS